MQLVYVHSLYSNRIRRKSFRVKNGIGHVCGFGAEFFA
jgi:hypothetical protein